MHLEHRRNFANKMKTMTQTNQPIKFAARISNVLEVTVAGYVETAYWQRKLQGYHFQPAGSNGQTPVLISATSARYMGSPFRELSISTAVENLDDLASQPGYFMVQAFNSSAPFAWVERNLFRTPYEHGDLRVQGQPQAEMVLSRRGKTLLAAGMAVGQRSPETSLDEDWLLPIFLPGHAAGTQRYFFARLSGHTQVYPFLSGRDSLDLQAQSIPGLTWLQESGFTPKEWRIRLNASHAKSKTYQV